ncbi:MAG: hypothetical protein V4719_29420 [Planctomycetota bacterium]
MSDDSEGAWWKTLGFGLLCLGISVVLYYFFTDLETNGGHGRIHWVIALIYNFAGKWVACGVVAFFGLVLTWMGIEEFRANQ